MSKFGVGVGDDFPVDDGSGGPSPSDQGPRDDRAEYEDWKRQRDAYRARRDEWNSRKDAFREKIRAAAEDGFGRKWDDFDGGRYHGWRFGGQRSRFSPFVFLIPIAVIVLFVALIVAIVKSPFVFLALAAAVLFFFVYRHRHGDHHGWHGHRYDYDLKPASGPSANVETPSAPPPAPQDGGK